MAEPGTNITSVIPSTPTSSPEKLSEATVGTYATLVILVMFFVIIGNSIVLLVLYRQRKQNNTRVANMFFANLAIVDLAVGVLLFPFSAITVIAGRWIFDQAICEVNGFLNTTAGTASILTMAVISVDRYRAIVSPPGRKLRARQAWILLSVVWLWSIIMAILPVLGWNEYSHSAYSSQCKMSFSKDGGYVLLAAVTCFVIPLTVMFYCYLRVFIKVRHHRQQLQRWQSTDAGNMKSEAKTAKIVFTVLFAFVALWAPFVVVSIVQASSTVNVPPGLVAFFNLTAGAHSACNPVIYVTLNRKFRGDLLEMTPCLARTAECWMGRFSTRVSTVELQSRNTYADCAQHVNLSSPKVLEKLEIHSVNE